MLKPAELKYKETVAYLVNNYFPELKDKKIYLFKYKFRTFWASALWVLPFRVILISPKVDKLDDAPLHGLLGHELSHLSIYGKKGWFKYLYTYPPVYLFSRKKIIKEENTVDKLTIKKGLGKSLFEMRKIVSQDEKHARVNYLYLTEEEILQHTDNECNASKMM
ncbi:MAG: hypothetical protein ACYC40_05130 [Patescibacteria group bacterium]